VYYVHPVFHGTVNWFRSYREEYSQDDLITFLFLIRKADLSLWELLRLNPVPGVWSPATLCLHIPELTSVCWRHDDVARHQMHFPPVFAQCSVSAAEVQRGTSQTHLSVCRGPSHLHHLQVWRHLASVTLHRYRFCLNALFSTAVAFRRRLMLR
jgi:hypothetical protein